MPVGNLHTSTSCCGVAGSGGVEEGTGVRRMRKRREGGIVA